MATLVTNAIEANDFLSTLWALLGVRDAAVVVDGTGGCGFFLLVNASVATRHGMQGRFFTTVLEEEDVTLGGSEAKLAGAIRNADRARHPALIAVVSNPVASLIGVDTSAVLREVAPEIGARLVAFTGGGWRDDAEGAVAQTLLTLCAELCPPGSARATTGTDRVNVLGPTAETFNWASDEAELRRLLGLLDLQVGTVLTARTTTDEIAAAPAARLNLVTRAAALPAARLLEEAFGTPIVHGLPYGRRGTLEWLQAVADATGRSLPPGVDVDELRRFPPAAALEIGGHWRRGALRVALAAPAESAAGLARLVGDDWGAEVAVVRLPHDPGPDAVRALEVLGAERVLVAPDEATWRSSLAEIRPDLLLGNADDAALAPPGVPSVCVSAPAHGIVDLYDRTPFVGWRGHDHLTQTVANLLRHGGRQS